MATTGNAIDKLIAFSKYIEEYLANMYGKMQQVKMDSVLLSNPKSQISDDLIIV